jgi:hypothetical protein
MSKYHIAQINIARMLAPIDDPVMGEFVAQLEPINALADGSPGFVWRLQTEEGDATSLKVYDDDMIIVNMSVWESVESLREYAYKSAHSKVMRDRKRWFEKFDGAVLRPVVGFGRACPGDRRRKRKAGVLKGTWGNILFLFLQNYFPCA